MHSKIKKILVFALVLTMLMPMGTVFADNENAEDTANDTSDTSTENGDEAEDEEEEKEVASDIIDLAVDTTAGYVKSNMSQIGTDGKYSIYKGTVKDKKNLQTLVDGAEYQTPESYTEDSYAEYNKSIEAGKIILADMTATQRQIDEASVAIDRATAGLVISNTVETPFEEPETVDKTSLQTTIDGLSPDLVKADYTEYTWEIYTNAVQNAKAINSNGSATQKEVNDAITEISFAMGKLLKAPEEVLAVISQEDEGSLLVATISLAEAESGKALNISKNGTWVVETNSNYSTVTNFYIRLLSHKASNTYVTTKLNEIYLMDIKSGEVSDTFTFDSSDNENGRLFKNADGKIIFTTLETDRLLAMAEEVSDNANFTLYADSENSKVAMYDKGADKYWWSTPVNPYGDSTVIDETKGATMKLPQRNQSASSLILQYGDLRQEKRNETYVYSKVAEETGKVKETWALKDNGITITYTFDIGFTVPVKYTLFDDRVDVSVDISEVKEQDPNTVSGRIITSLALTPTFGAAPKTDLAGNDVDGYMVVPDGSGAVINYNNGKEGYSPYTQMLYGRDITNVPQSAPRVTEQAYLPVIATVSGKTGLVAIATEGDSNATVNAKVSKMDKQAFNSVYFEFNLRGSDTFFMGGSDGTKITVFEKGNIKTDKIAVSYYPISDKEEVNYADVAEVYRNYLINEKGLEKKTQANQTSLYIDLFGSVLKQTSVLGIPVDMKTEVTGFNQAEEILQQLADGGVTNTVVNYSDWTNNSINGNISTKFKPSGKLGGKTEMLDLISNVSSQGIEIYPSLSNMEMK
ncbi:MAG: hypothetical protein GX896_09610, partial [Clostridiales bacterium]|nr:hypothetical protein [Clostridiales bacterium]